MPRTGDERALVALRILSEAAGLAFILLQLWDLAGWRPEAQGALAEVRRWWNGLGEADRRRKAEAALIFDLRMIEQACPHEVGRAAARLSEYGRHS